MKMILAATAAVLVLGAATTASATHKGVVAGAATGAVAGAVVGGPVGAVVGAGVGAVTGHEVTNHGRHYRRHRRHYCAITRLSRRPATHTTSIGLVRRRHGRQSVAGAIVIAMGFAAGHDRQRYDGGG